MTTALARLEGGNTSNVKSLGSGVHEYKIDFGPGYRVYFAYDGKTLVILLAGGTKNASKPTSTRQRIAGKTTSNAKKKRMEVEMPLTKKFKDTVMARAKADKNFREELIIEATNALLEGEIDTGKSLIRDYLNATEAFADVASQLQKD